MNKEELKDEATNKQREAQEHWVQFQVYDNVRFYYSGKEDAFSEILDLIDQLDEPEKSVVLICERTVEKESEETEVKKDKLIKELEEAKLQTSKEWLDGFNKGIERAIELTEANRETEEDIPTVPLYVAKEIEKISKLSEGWDFRGLVNYLAGDGIVGIKDNKGVYGWVRLNKKLFLQLLGGSVYKVGELEE